MQSNALEGVRVVLLRLDDSAVFSGELDCWRPPHFAIRAPIEEVDCEGKRFLASLDGPLRSLNVPVHITRLSPILDEQSIRRLEMEAVGLMSPAEYRLTERREIDGLKGVLNAEGFAIEVDVINVSPTGLGVLAKDDFVDGAQVEFVTTIDGHSLSVPCEVRHWHVDEKERAPYRGGLTILRMDRLQAALWKRVGQ